MSCSHQAAVAKAMERLHQAGIAVSLFIDPDLRQIEIAKLLGAKAIEIQTARYSEAKTHADRQHELNTLQEATEYAKQHGLNVHMGHGLNYENVHAVAADPRRRGIEHRPQHRVAGGAGRHGAGGARDEGCDSRGNGVRMPRCGLRPVGTADGSPAP